METTTNNQEAVDLAGEHVGTAVDLVRSNLDRIVDGLANGEVAADLSISLVTNLNTCLATLEAAIRLDQHLAALPAVGGRVRVDSPEINDGDEFDALLLHATHDKAAVQALYTGDLFLVDIYQILRD